MKEKQKNILIGVLIFIIIALIVGICYLTIFSKENTLNTNKNNSNIQTDCDCEKESGSSDNSSTDKEGTKSKVCTGTYYGEATGTSSNGLTYVYEDTYTLNDDNSFTASLSGLGRDGYYYINDNTITFTNTNSS